MAREYAMMYEENELSLRIPADAHSIEGFSRWAKSDEFPAFGRIDFLAGDIEADMRPEGGTRYSSPRGSLGGA